MYELYHLLAPPLPRGVYYESDHELSQHRRFISNPSAIKDITRIFIGNYFIIAYNELHADKIKNIFNNILVADDVAMRIELLR